ncbi:NAD-P-binding protein [Lentinus tigrinus ALCF2SS1-7]|uniref:NAD-P-binding protein n=1 Tax=Lentinus tigrinus ALCF2SS1-6 TaxID=1328759 RepID=A0A5C2S064_9APHY|nr:NAD-P-binding protein [Lentinus tigrinus ALCF2SS1-6]RPD71618.1 NAD-P-binding protein [Lentinus tigrinus ALCF2SS1-7]
MAENSTTSSSGPRVWLITGTSTGIGRALVQLALEKGEIVLATARSPAPLEDLTEKYSSTRLLVLPLDITQPDQVRAVFSRGMEAFGRIDVVVNNAGCTALGEVELMDEARGRDVLETNFWGTLRVTREAVRFFREENPPGLGGRLLQMSSFLGLTGSSGSGAGFYVASKFALEGITETLASELDPKWNIKITLLEPGWIRSAAASKTVWSPEEPHPAYAANPALPTTAFRSLDLDTSNLIPWKDTRRSVEELYKVASLPDPPLHFLLGKDAIVATRAKIADLSGSIDKYETWSEGLEE